ncbi:COP9 signalosome complex subunit 7b [Coemansia sp. IMI 203386]|nr:COP9 signalosome complex subunit 7b [Coemansia sp. IMI 203386]
MDAYLNSLKTASTDADVVSVIQKALDDEDIYHFGQLLESPVIAKLTESDEYKGYRRLLEIFSFETLAGYRLSQAQLPQLNKRQTEKLKHLTLLSLASDAKVIPYDRLMKELEFDSEQQVEDMVIDTIYKKLLSAKLDQQRQLIEVDYVIGRDARKGDLQKIHNMLSEWATVCEGVIEDISHSIKKANADTVFRRRDEREFTLTLQELRTSHAVALAAGNNPGNIARTDSQFSSSEYRNEQQRTGGRF